MGERVVIYEKDREALTFLKSFFGGRRGFLTEFADDVVSLRKAFSEDGGPTLFIAPVNEIKQLLPIPRGSSLIATIRKNTADGIESAVKKGADNYILPPFSAEDLDFKIKDIARRRETVDTLRQETNDLQTLIELGHLVSSTFNPREILYLIVKKISEVIPVMRCSIIRVDSDGRYALVISGFEDPNLKKIKLDLRKYPEIRKALTSKEPVIIKDVSTDPLMERVKDLILPLGIRSIIVVPIIYHEEVIGTLFLRTSRRQSSFTRNEIKLCRAIAGVSANALNNAFLFERVEDEKARLERLAITDFLTGVFNIRYFYHRLSEEFSRAERYGLPLSCLMLDIDHFKDINDRFGHRVGDIVLREFAQFLRKRTRKSDVLARYGGEEFIMLLTQTPAGGAVTKAEAFRFAIQEYEFNGLKGEKGPTVSIGIATHPHPHIKNKDDLITLSDNALYEAKNSGRNRVVLYRP